MKRTRLFLMTAFILAAVMLFTACGGLPKAGKKLSDEDVMKLVDSYNLEAFNDDFASATEISYNAAGVALTAKLTAEFHRTKDFYTAHAKLEMPTGLLDMLSALMGIEDGDDGETDTDTDYNILGMLLQGGEFWLGENRLMMQIGNEKGYLELPESMPVLTKNDFSINGMIKKVFDTFKEVSGEDIDFEVLKADGTIDWDTIASLMELEGAALTKFKELVNMLPIDAKGEISYSKFFKNFTTYTLSYANKKNTITFKLNLKTFVEKILELQIALGNNLSASEKATILSLTDSILGDLNFKIVLGQNYFESFEVSAGTTFLTSILASYGDADSLNSLVNDPSNPFKDTTITIKSTITYGKQTINIPAITGFEKI